MGKCYKMASGQISFLRYLKKIRQYATILVGLAVLTFESQAQDSSIEIVYKDSCLITGKLKVKNKYGRNASEANFKIWVIIDTIIYETLTDSKGYFELLIPSNQKIDHSNIKKIRDLENEKLPPKKDLGKVVYVARRFPKGLSFHSINNLHHQNYLP